MLIIEKRNNFKIVIDLLGSILSVFLIIVYIALSIKIIFFVKWTNIGSHLFLLVLFIFGVFVFSNMIYQSITKILSENFKIELNDQHFIVKSTFINKTIKYYDIDEIFIVRRHYSRWRETELLKIKSKSGERVFISFGVLDKKEKKELKRIFKEKIGKKVRDKFQFWE